MKSCFFLICLFIFRETASSLKKYGVKFQVFDDVLIEPTDKSESWRTFQQISIDFQACWKRWNSRKMAALTALSRWGEEVSLTLRRSDFRHFKNHYTQRKTKNCIFFKLARKFWILDGRPLRLKPSSGFYGFHRTSIRKIESSWESDVASDCCADYCG